MLDDPARLAAVREVEAAVLPEPPVLGRLTGLTGRLLDVPFAFLSLLGHEVERLVAVRAPGQVPATLPRDRSVCQHLVRSGQPLLVPDLRAHPDLRGLSEVQALGLRSYAGSPVRVGDDLVLGGLCVGDSRPRDWSPQDADLLDRLAEVVSDELADRLVLHGLRAAHDDERRRAEEQAALHRTAALVARGADPAQVLQQAAEELVDLLDARAAAVLRFEPDGGTRVLASAGTSRPSVDSATWAVHLLARVRSTGSSSSTVLHEQPCAAVPVVVGGDVWGSVVVLLGPDGSQGRVAQLEQLAGLVALVLANTEAQDRLTRLARSDPLTGAANRRVLEERLAVELPRCARTGAPLVVALLDLDHFKAVNDRHGHAAGDDVLCALTERVDGVLREADLLARLGGDEWGLLLPDAGAGAQEALARVREAVVSAPLAGLPVTVTIGAVVVTGGSPVQVLREADAALYEAKRQGRDRVVVRVTVSP